MKNDSLKYLASVNFVIIVNKMSITSDSDKLLGSNFLEQVPGNGGNVGGNPGGTLVATIGWLSLSILLDLVDNRFAWNA